MSWIKDGQHVKGTYCGAAIAGTVLESRVKYGGRVQYTIKLDEPIQLRWRDEKTDIVLLDDTEAVFS